MKTKEAVKLLEKAGYIFLRMGRGSHAIYEKAGKRIVISAGTNLSPGMVGKVKSACKY